jgi:glycosyltransferase involved in cell wall biosynthesis
VLEVSDQQVLNDMITVVYSTRKENPEYQKHIKQTIGLKDFEILEYTNNREYSLTELYNRGLKESSNDIVIFIHDDLLFEQDSKWGKKVLRHFNNSDFGILGKAGTTSLTESGRWWDESHLMIGSVYHTQYYEDTKKRVTWESRYSGLFHDKIIPTVLVDGLFIAVNKNRIKKNFDENIKGFHLYDVDFCVANFHAGVNIGVIFDFKLTHKSIGKTNDEWEQNRKQLVQKWGLFTDDDGNKKLGLPISIQPNDIHCENVKVRIKEEPKVAVIIPTKSKLDILFKCLDSFRNKSNYNNYKIYIADTGSSDNEILSIQNYIDNHDYQRYELIRYDYYNFAKINNDVVNNHIDKDTELLLFSNNDIELLNDAVSIMVDQYNRC